MQRHSARGTGSQVAQLITVVVLARQGFAAVLDAPVVVVLTVDSLQLVDHVRVPVPHLHGGINCASACASTSATRATGRVVSRAVHRFCPSSHRNTRRTAAQTQFSDGRRHTRNLAEQTTATQVTQLQSRHKAHIPRSACALRLPVTGGDAAGPWKRTAHPLALVATTRQRRATRLGASRAHCQAKAGVEENGALRQHGACNLGQDTHSTDPAPATPCQGHSPSSCRASGPQWSD